MTDVDIDYYEGKADAADYEQAAREDAAWDTAKEAEEAEAGGTEAKPRGIPSIKFTPSADGELPANPPRAKRGPDMRLYRELVNVIADPELHNVWGLVIQFRTPNGAKRVRDAIVAGDRAIPEGDWDFETRMVDDEAVGKRVSQLWARYNAS